MAFFRCNILICGIRVNRLSRSNAVRAEYQCLGRRGMSVEHRWGSACQENIPVMTSDEGQAQMMKRGWKNEACAWSWYNE
jgi:hypothetical protein